MVAMETIFYQPLGAGGMSHHYEKIAKEKGYFKNGHPRAAHNHYANIIMYDGLIGVAVVCALFIGLLKKIFLLRNMRRNGVQLILAAACITAVVHAASHNAGFFKLEPATLIVFGLLWGATQGQPETV
jgi:O-antigen ligase